MVESKTRIYEVVANVGPSNAAHAGPESTKGVRTFLVDATSRRAAERHIAKKYVSEASLPNGKRIAELMSSGVKPETAADEDGK